MEIDLSAIIVNGRHRKHLGDIRALADSIEEVGLLHPLVISPEKLLLAGGRRLEALKLLGRKRAPVHVVRGLDEVIERVTAEGYENTCRKEFAPSEGVSLGRDLEKLEGPKAAERKAAGQKSGGRGKKKLAENFSASNGRVRTLDKVGKIVGMSRITYQRASAIVQAAEEHPVIVPLVDEMDAKGKVNGVYQKMKRLLAEAHRKKVTKGVRIHSGVRLGDFRQALADVPDSSVDLIFTDPPYDKASIPMYGDLAQLACRVLKDGGSLFCYAGQYALPAIFPLMTGLRYQWMLAVRHSGGQRRMHGWRVRVGWKPLLWFVKGRYLGDYLLDMLDSEPGDKLAHEWAQGNAEAAYLIERVCPAGGIVLDPMAGSGTTLLAAKMLDRKFVGVEIDTDRAKVASSKLNGHS